ncbi:MAG: VOC family protein [Rhodothermaceae bacterium]
MINCYEIPATDIDRAIKFYSQLFQVEIKKADYETEQMGFFPENCEICGMISRAEKFNPSADGVIIYFDGGKNIDEKLELAVKAGGEIVKPKTQIEAENAGCFALIKDTEGNRIGLYSK